MSKKKNINFIEFSKPQNSGDGTNIQFSYSPDNGAIFMTMAKQVKGTSVKDARFDYDHKIIFKLGVYDLCDFIDVFSGKKDRITNSRGDGIVHKSGKNVTSIVNLKKNDPKYGGFYLNMQKDDKENNFKVFYSGKISDQEAYVLTVLFNFSIVKMHNWGVDKSFFKKDNE